MRKMNCELCKNQATMYCESDQASLCWTCDAMVHSANFLVARHSRTLLCHVCQSLTAWTASGANLGSTVSVCQNCAVRGRGEKEEEEEWDQDEEDESISVTEEDDGNDSEEEVDLEENQVVPWSSTPPPSAASSSSSNEESADGQAEVSRKRPRENGLDEPYNEENDSTLSQKACAPPATAEEEKVGHGGGAEDEADFVDPLSMSIGVRRMMTRPWKARRVETGRAGLVGSRKETIKESLRRIHQREMGSGAAASELLKLSGESTAVDLETAESSETMI